MNKRFISYFFVLGCFLLLEGCNLSESLKEKERQRQLQAEEIRRQQLVSSYLQRTIGEYPFLIKDETISFLCEEGVIADSIRGEIEIIKGCAYNGTYESLIIDATNLHIKRIEALSSNVSYSLPFGIPQKITWKQMKTYFTKRGYHFVGQDYYITKKRNINYYGAAGSAPAGSERANIWEKHIIEERKLNRKESAYKIYDKEKQEWIYFTNKHIQEIQKDKEHYEISYETYGDYLTELRVHFYDNTPSSSFFNDLGTPLYSDETYKYWESKDLQIIFRYRTLIYIIKQTKNV